MAAKLFLTVSLLFYFQLKLCVNQELINESSENYTPHIWGILNYFNTDPNRIYNYNVGVLQNAQKTETGLILQVEVQVECRLSPSDPRCGPKVHTCEAAIEKIEGIDRYEILPGASCHPKVESTEQTENIREPPVQSSSVLQVNDEPTSSIQSSNEGAPDHEFVAIRRNSNHCLGCVIDLDTNVEGLPELITTALKHVESERDKKHVLLKILRVQQQVVAGIKFILDLEIAQTVCDKNVETVNPTTCPLDNTLTPQVCNIVYFQKPWISLQKHIISNNCTLSQEYTDASKPVGQNSVKGKFPNDLDNEIDISSGYNNDQFIADGEHYGPKNVPNFDEIANSGRFDVDNLGEIDPSRLAKIESQIIVQKINSTENATATDENLQSTPSVSESSDNFQITVENSPVISNEDVVNTASSIITPEDVGELQGPEKETVTPEIKQRKKRSTSGKSSFKKNSHDKEWLKRLARYVVENKLGPNEVSNILEVQFPKQQKNKKLGGSVYSFLIHLKKSNLEKLESCKAKVLITENKSDKKILKFKCYNDKKSHKKLSRVPRAPVRPGGEWEVSLSDPKIQELTHSSLLQLNLNSNVQNKYKVVELISAKKQVVAGLLYTIKAKIITTDCNQNDLQDPQQCLELENEQPKVCDIIIWDRPWISNGRETNITCENDANVYFFKSESPRPRSARSITEDENHEIHKSDDYVGLFEKFILAHNKQYDSRDEYKYRFKIFQENMKIIYLLNKYEQGTGKYGVTKFSDLTSEEFQRYKGLRTDLNNRNEVGMAWAKIPDVDLPIEFDWRSLNAVTEVKNQGSCGSCWAFSVTGNVEGQYAIKHGNLLEFSEQELVDCDNTDDGCNGGYMSNAYRAIEKLGGLETEKDYPYDARQETCHFKNAAVKVQVTGAVNISSNETEMAQWLVQNGPISIGINANAMQFYLGGVSHPWKFLCNPANIDHGVLIVGYGVHKYPYLKKTMPYWIVKNSWGKSWGQQGYYLVYRGDGTCGVNTMASSAIIE